MTTIEITKEEAIDNYKTRLVQLRNAQEDHIKIKDRLEKKYAILAKKAEKDKNIAEELMTKPMKAAIPGKRYV